MVKFFYHLLQYKFGVDYLTLDIALWLVCESLAMVYWSAVPLQDLEKPTRELGLLASTLKLEPLLICEE